MKRIGYIYEKICDIENVKTAIEKASLGKRNQRRVRCVLENIDLYSEKVSELLKTQSYYPSPYIVKTIKDGSSGKERTIYKPKFYPDQIIHWALILQIEKIIMKGMYYHNCGSIPRRGIHRGKKYIEKWIRDDTRYTKYCLKTDISKFYPSINNEILKKKFRKIIKDNKCLSLIDIIIDSADGLPIGNYTSQWFANFFLQDLDHFIKENLHIKYYIRYIDDFVMFDSNKRKLHKARVEIEKYLYNEKLSLKSNWQVFKTDCRPIDFLGFKFYRDKTILRKKNSLRIKRRLKRIHAKGFLNIKDARCIISYLGWVKNTNGCFYYNKNIKPYISKFDARNVIRNESKKNCICSNSRV